MIQAEEDGCPEIVFSYLFLVLVQPQQLIHSAQPLSSVLLDPQGKQHTSLVPRLSYQAEDGLRT